MKNWKYHENYETSKRHVRRKTHILISIAIIGVIVAGFAVGLVQANDAKKAYIGMGKSIMDETVQMINQDQQKADSAEKDYEELSQSIVTSALPSLSATGADELIAMMPTASAAEIASKKEEVSQALSELCIGENGAMSFLIDNDGSVLASNKNEYLQVNIKDTLLSQGDFSYLVRYGVDAESGTSYDGTKGIDADGKTSIKSAFFFTENGSLYAAFSSHYATSGGTDYFFVVAQKSDWLYSVMISMFSFDSTLSKIKVGNGGFMFAINKTTNTILYFENDGKNYIGKNPSDIGLNDSIYETDYTGYQTILGTSYLTLTEEIVSPYLDEDVKTIIGIAVVPQQSLFSQSATSIFFAIIVFASVIAIYAVYGLLLRRDVAVYAFDLRKEYSIKLRDQVVAGKFKYTDEEIEERADVHVDELFYEGKDQKLNRIRVGVRNSKGVQRYFGKVFTKKMIPAACFSLIGIFAVTYFASTLNRMQDVTNASSTHIEGQHAIIDQRISQVTSISATTESGYVIRAKEASSCLSYNPEFITGGDEAKDKDAHALYKTASDGTKTPILDQYGHPRYATSENPILKAYCQENGMLFASLFDANGLVITTNSSGNWAENLYEYKEANQGFLEILEGKSNVHVSYDNNLYIAIGVSCHYYTVDAGDHTAYVSASDYQKQLEGSWTGPSITKQNGLVQTLVYRSSVTSIFGIEDIRELLKGVTVYGEGSFFMAFDKDKEHSILYSPFASYEKEAASDLGIVSDTYFNNDGFRGFQRINGSNYYQVVIPYADYYLAAAVPTSEIFGVWNRGSLISCCIALVTMGTLFAVTSFSSDKEDEDYETVLRGSNKVVALGKRTLFKGQHRFTRPTQIRETLWSQKTPDQKYGVMASAACIIIALVGLIITTLTLVKSGGTDIFSYIFSHQWSRGFNIFSVTESLIVMIAILVGTRLLLVVINFLTANVGSRMRTIGNLIVSTIRYGGIIGGIFFCLYLFGVNTEALWTSATIVGLVVGLGAQPLIGDLIAGIFLVFEGSMEVGDIVNIGGNRGEVMEIGLRTTKISEFGNIRIYNNSSIKGLLNLSKNRSYISTEIGISYEEDLERVERIIKKAIPEIKNKLPKILDGPFYSGVSSLDESEVVLKIGAFVNERDIYGAKRDLTREFYLLFQREGIDMSYNRVTLDFSEEMPGMIKQIKEAITEEKKGEEEK